MEIETTINPFESVLNGLPYNTTEIKKSLKQAEIISGAMVDKWYAGKSKLTDASLLKQVAKFLNENFPRADKTLITLEELAGIEDKTPVTLEDLAGIE